MKRLILITDHYPYTRGELPFVQPELAVTCQHFEVSVICKSPAEKQEYPLPPGVKLYHYHKDATMEEKIRNHQGPWKDQEEKYRVLWDGIACWPYLRYTYKTLKKLGINMVTSTYPKSWTVSYETGDIEGMARAYSANVYPNRNLNYDVANMVNLAKKFDLDGIIFHSNRSCKLMDFRQYEVQRRVLEECGVPSVIFDGDQTDPRLFSEAQYETRIQALAEMMAENKAKKGRAAQ